MRSSRWIMALAVAAHVPSGIAARADAPPAGTDRVEEDWELVIREPDPAAAGPQITTCMHPDQDNPSRFVAFNLNYRQGLRFWPGGLEVQAWAGGALVDSDTRGSAQCSLANERILWTQRMRLDGGRIEYSVEEGRSVTWGYFGGEGRPLGVDFDARGATLQSYRPETSAERSGVSWQENRVAKMTLLRVRYYAGDTLIQTDAQPRTVVDNSSP